MSLHLGKTQSILFGTKRRLSTGVTLNVICNGNVIESKSNVTYLVIDQFLSGEIIASNIIYKSSNKLKFPYRNAGKFNLETKKLLISDLIQCHFDYTCSAWYNGLSKKLKCRMQCTQNKIIRFMLNAPWRFHVGANEFKHVGLLPIEYRVEQLMLGHMFNIINGNAPTYSISGINMNQHRYSTRARELSCVIPRVKSSGVTSTLVFKGLHAENEHWRLVEDTHGQVGYAPAAFLVVILDTTAGEEENDATKKGQVNSTEENRIGGRIGQEGERRKSYSAAVIDGKKRKDTIYVGDSIMRKTDSRLSKGEDVVVCLPGARIEHVTERVEKIMGRGNGGSILVHVGTNNADKEGTTAMVEKYRDLQKKTKQARVGQIIISGILPVFGNRIQGYRNSKRMAVNGMVERLCKEEDVGYVDLLDSFVGREDMYRRDGLHLSGKGGSSFCRGTVRGGRQRLG